MCFMKGGFMENNFMEIWAQALEILQEEISPVGYKTYVDVMVPRIVDNNTLCFLSPSNYHIDICKKRYLDLIQNTLTFLTKKSYNITFEAKEMIPDTNNEQNEVVISPNTKTNPVVTDVSQATRAIGSFAKIASKIESEIWSAILSGCPSVTDSDVNKRRSDIK